MQTSGEVQAEHVGGQSKHSPFDKYLPMIHKEQSVFVEKSQDKQFDFVEQHSS